MATGLTKEKKLTVSLLIGNLILYNNCEHGHSMQLAIKPTQDFGWKTATYIYTPDLHIYTTIYVSYLYLFDS